MLNLFDKIIVVTTPEIIRLSRIAKRDVATEDEIKIRIQNQMPEEEKAKKADFLIVNDDEQLVIPQVLRIHQILTQ